MKILSIRMLMVAMGVMVVAGCGSTTTEFAPAVTVSGDVAVLIGATVTLQAKTENGTDSSYAWQSSNDAMATVDDMGMVTGVAKGTVVITATGADTGASGSWGVAVFEDGDVPKPEARVAITGGFSVKVGETLQLTAATTDGTDAGYGWMSSMEGVATVDDMGLVTGVASGEALITATGMDTGASDGHGIVVLAEPVLGTETPFEDLWAGSAHADAMAEAFVHWDEDDPPEVPTYCAKCHSTPGFQDFLGEDGTAAGVVDNAAPVGTVITCVACHNASALALNKVEFPSGAVVEGLGAEARCMSCHQGRESTTSLNEFITDAAPADDDDQPLDGEGKPKLAFKNIHYFAAGATLYGGQAMGGYQYDGKMYDAKFAHVEGYDTCMSCHDPHTLEVKVDECTSCHMGVATVDDLKDVRMLGSMKDYDGDGDTAEGIYYEITSLQTELYAAIQAYAVDTAGQAIVYDAHAYPYFFKDLDGDGEVDEDEANYGNQYKSWTPRLLRAAFNYQFSHKDPGAFVHNAKYVIELLFDSLEDLGVDVSGKTRIDAGHFAGSTEAFRHWDDPEDEGMVSANCSRCHTATGLPFYNQTGTTVPEPTANGFACSTCHPKLPEYDTQLEFDETTFPSGLVVDSGSNTANMCMTCHQGRESKANVDIAIQMSGAGDDDTVPVDLEGKGLLNFKNIHYFAAGATLFGTEAQGAYEYDGKHYDGRFSHVAAFLNCNDCHDVHSQEVKVATCAECHAGADSLEALQDIRMAGSFVDYDGDGLEEGIQGEIETLRDKLYDALKVYAKDVGGNGIVYDSHAYPYFFVDNDGDGIADKGTDGKSIRYNGFFTPRSLRAAYNFQYARKDPGAFAHNAKYLIKILYDTIEDLGGDLTGLTRNDGAHFDTTSDAFRHWDFDPEDPDDTGFVGANCARCHTPTGFIEYLETGMIEGDHDVSYGLTCETCHTGSNFAAGAPLKEPPTVTFPSGVTIENNGVVPDTSFLCMTCHQGRESMASIDEATEGMTPDDVPMKDGKPALGFKNVHYLSAGASLYGSVAMVAYQYPGKTYVGKFTHWGQESPHCSYCHVVTGDKHAFEPQITTEGCFCHSEATPGDLDTIRKDRPTDYDGDGDNAEPLADEIDALAVALYSQIQTYATAHGGSVVYEGHTYPYFFKDDGNGVVDPGEAIYPNGYKNWTPRMLRAAHNFQIAQKEHGAWAHNTDYTVQVLIDAIEDLGGDVSMFNRP